MGKLKAFFTRKRVRIILMVLAGLLLVGAIVSAFIWPPVEPVVNPTATRSVTPTGEASPTAAAVLENPPVVEITPISNEQAAGLRDQGFVFLALTDGLYTHLFAYHPEYLPLVRLTNTPWDDADPTISPDGKVLAYASRQNGYWDIYLLNLETGEQTRVTDTPAYDGAPTWSPDGEWLAYETYTNDNLEIYIQSISDPTQDPIQLTSDPAADFSPAWSPQGREIAFTSTRNGNQEIWTARLDSQGERFTNLSQTPGVQEDHPAWSPDGAWLAWSADGQGTRQIMVWDTAAPGNPARALGSGDWPAWSPGSDAILTAVVGPNQTGLTAYALDGAKMILPFLDLPGAVRGLEWKALSQPADDPLPPLLQINLPAPETLYTPEISLTQMAPAGRYGIVGLPDVTAPYPYLHDQVDEAYSALRAGVGVTAGWDFLLSLENAYKPITYPVSPGVTQDWLYTGRAFALNPIPLDAGWLVAVREEIGSQTYWRVYIKARYQDGSQGTPLQQMIWDLNARYSGDPLAYEAGGQVGPVPAGYWIDFTDLAARYGWQRLSAFRNWPTYYPATRFNQFVMTGGLTWEAAMDQLYPVEALITPTYVPTYTPEPTATPRPTRGPTQATPTLTPTATLRPTWTLPPPTPNP